MVANYLFCLISHTAGQQSLHQPDNTHMHSTQRTRRLAFSRTLCQTPLHAVCVCTHHGCTEPLLPSVTLQSSERSSLLSRSQFVFSQLSICSSCCQGQLFYFILFFSQKLVDLWSSVKATQCTSFNSIQGVDSLSIFLYIETNKHKLICIKICCP